MWTSQNAEGMASLEEIPNSNASSPGGCPGLPSDFCAPRWYAAYTRAHHEKRVAEQLALRSVENFLPLYESTRRWKDRRVQLQLPLFPGYLFVRLALRDRLQVLEIPSVVRMVGFNGHPAVLADKEIQALRISTTNRLEPHPYLTVGRRVRIKRGPLEGVEGILIRKKNAFRVVLSIDLIMRSASVEIDAGDIERTWQNETSSNRS
jgi:transcription antitermination factor NusG